MGLFNTKINENSTGPQIRNTVNRTEETVGLVIAADEKSNLCTVMYVDQNGTSKTAKNCMVDLRHGPTGWFPKMLNKGKQKNRNTGGGQHKNLPAVLFKPDGVGSGTVLSEYTENYEKDIKSGYKYQNNTSDGDPNMCGGQITQY